MPTQLNGVSVTVNGKPAYVYFYCSAVTDASCADDQINVLTPLDSTTGSVPIVVTSSGTSTPSYAATMNTVVPSFLLFGKGYIAATHVNYNLIGPATLYPGASTPAAPGEPIVTYATGFGLPTTTLDGGLLGADSGVLPSVPVCTIGGNPAPVGYAGIVSPGLYQLNITVPSNAGAKDNSISCTYGGSSSAAGDLVTVN